MCLFYLDPSLSRLRPLLLLPRILASAYVSRRLSFPLSTALDPNEGTEAFLRVSRVPIAIVSRFVDARCSCDRNTSIVPFSSFFFLFVSFPLHLPNESFIRQAIFRDLVASLQERGNYVQLIETRD